MSADKLTFLDETPEDTEETVVEAAPEAVDAPAEPEPEGTGEEAAPPAAEDKAERFVPITAILDEREKRQTAQREAEEARKALEEMRRQIAQAQRPPEPKDPQQRLVMAFQQQEQARWSDKLDLSETMAAQVHGPETVETAKAAFLAEVKANPALYTELQRQRHPYDFVVKWHKRHATVSAMGDDPEAYIAAQVEARLAERLAAVQPSPAPNPRVPPSMARAPAAGRERTSPGTAFDAMFG